MSPRRLARKEPNLCDFSALDMAGYRCFSGVREPDQGPQRKSNVVNYFLTGLDPDGCLVADQRKVYAKHLKYRVQINKRVTSALFGDPAKNETIFAMDRCFLLTWAF